MSTPQKQVYPSASLYVGDLHKDVTEAFLYEVFKEAGSIISIRVCRDAVTRESLGYGYVNFSSLPDAERAMESLNFTVINDKPIRIMWSQRDPSLRKTGVGNIFIKNLDVGIDNKSLRDTFQAFGEILSCKVQHRPNRKTGVGFVHYKTKEAAEKAIEKVNGMLLNGTKVIVEHYKQSKKRKIDDTNFTNVYIKNIDKSVDDKKLNEFLSKYGKVQNASIMKGKNGESRGFAFCNFFEHAGAKECVTKLHDQEVKGFSAEGKKFNACRHMSKSERNQVLREKFQKEGTPLYKQQGTNLYIKHLDETITDEKLKEYFSQCGEITSCCIMKDDNGNSKGFGFVNFKKAEEATKAITELNEKIFGKKPLYIGLAQPKEVRRQQMASKFNFKGPGTQQHPGTPLFYPNMGQMMQGGRGGGYQQFQRQRFQQPYQGGMNMRNQRGYKLNQNARNTRQEKHNKFPNKFPGGPQPMHKFPGGPQPMHKFPGGPQPMHKFPGGPQQMHKFPPQQLKKFPPQRIPQNTPPNPSQPINQRQIPTSTILSQYSKKEQKKVLGEFLYPIVCENCAPEEAGKITGMLLEMENADIIHLLETPNDLRGKVKEATELLRKNDTVNQFQKN